MVASALGRSLTIRWSRTFGRNRSQDFGRSNNGNLYFEGPTIFSYGSHFAIAIFTDFRVGAKRVVLFTEGSYRVTTSGHCSDARHALQGRDDVVVIPVPSLRKVGELAGRILCHAPRIVDPLGESPALGAPGFHSERPTLVRRRGNELETSRGASAPLPEAVNIFRAATACRVIGKAWHRNGERMRVGALELDAIDPAGDVRVGCHSIAYDEMTRLAVREVPDFVRPCFQLPALCIGA